jgi:C4-type Zn-finger protein
MTNDICPACKKGIMFDVTSAMQPPEMNFRYEMCSVCGYRHGYITQERRKRNERHDRDPAGRA